MSNSSAGGRGMFGSRAGGRRGGGAQLAVIDMNAQRSSVRRAKIAFGVTVVVVGLLTATVASHKYHPIVGAVLGIWVGFLAGLVVGGVVFAWPVLRVVWHWSIEIGVGLLLVYGWTGLMQATPLWLSLLLVAGLIGVPVGWGPVRRRLMSVVWCVIVRHRLRLCFTSFIHAAGSVQAGNAPLILWARPTPAGERVWVWLRPGLSLEDLEGRTDKVAVACWATTARVASAAGAYAALVRIDLTRRDPLLATVRSPLVDLLPDDDLSDAPTSPGMPPVMDLDLDLTGITEPAAADKPKRGRTPRTEKPAEVTASAVEDDLSAWI